MWSEDILKMLSPSTELLKYAALRYKCSIFTLQYVLYSWVKLAVITYMCMHFMLVLLFLDFLFASDKQDGGVYKWE